MKRGAGWAHGLVAAAPLTARDTVGEETVFCSQALAPVWQHTLVAAIEPASVDAGGERSVDVDGKLDGRGAGDKHGEKLVVLALSRAALHEFDDLGKVQREVRLNFTLRVISEISIFSGLTHAERSLLVSELREESRPSGTTIISEGELSDEIDATLSTYVDGPVQLHIALIHRQHTYFVCAWQLGLAHMSSLRQTARNDARREARTAGAAAAQLQTLPPATPDAARPDDAYARAMQRAHTVNL